MEFGEKLQELRKNKGLTQEELGEILFVTRTTISKWESGRGYPSIDSLKAISSYFHVSIDDLLTADKALDLAQNEQQTKLQYLYAFIDFLHLALIVLPIYPKEIDGFIYCVNLWHYDSLATYNQYMYWFLFYLFVIHSLLECIFKKKVIQYVSYVLSIITIFYLVLTREVYACIIVVIITILKTILLFNHHLHR